MPSNIIWENLGNLKKETDHRRRNVFLIIAAIMFINGSVYSGLKQLNANNSQRYPSYINCTHIQDSFKGNEQKFFEVAQQDKNDTLMAHGHGDYMCYCKTRSYFLSDKETQNLCRVYKLQWVYGVFFNNIVTGLIAATNFGLRTTNIALVRYIGQKTFSKQTRSVMMTIAAAQFINTGCLLLLTTADMKYAPWPFYFLPFRRNYVDLNYQWYIDIGPSLLKNLLIQAMMPWIELVIFWTIKKI